MTDPTVADQGDPPAAFTLKDPGIASSKTQQAGTEKIDRKDQLETEIRVAYTVPAKGNGKFYPIKQHESFLQALHKADPSLIIIPLLESVNPYTNVDEMPKSEAEFLRQFTQVEEKVAGSPRRIVICHKVRTLQSIGDIKFRNPEFFQYLRDNKIMLTVDKFKTKASASIGFLFEIHPGLTNRDRLRFFLHDLLGQVDMDEDELKTFTNKNSNATETAEEDDDESMTALKLVVPDFELLVSTVGFGNGKDRITTRAIDIHCAVEDAALLKELFSRCKLTDHDGSGRFIPRGLAQMATTTVYKNYLWKHNKFLQEITQVPIFGLSRAAANYLIRNHDTASGKTSHMPVRAIIEKSASVISLEPTNRTDELGKWFLITTKARLEAAQTLVDTAFKELFDTHIPKDKPELRFPDFPHPRRPVRPSYSLGILSYAETLQKAIGNQEDTSLNRPPARPQKRIPVTFVYDPNEFPTPPSKKKQPSNGKTTNSANSSVTHANTTQTSDEIRESIMKEIKIEVTKMIQTEMSSILEQCKTLITQSLATYQAQIQTTITNEIRKGFQGPPIPAQQQAHQQTHQQAQQQSQYQQHQQQQQYYQSPPPPPTAAQTLAASYGTQPPSQSYGYDPSGTAHYGTDGTNDQPMSEHQSQPGHNPAENNGHAL
jgi:hypothetical protein